MSILLPAPAKVNLALEVGPRLPDGYHRVRTVFQSVNLRDLLRLDHAAAIEVSCDHPEVPGGVDNLAGRAAQALWDALPPGMRRPGVQVRLFKVIPPAAGLGGASSDAAAVLRGLTWLWRTRPSRARLQELASRLGSDVPFFLGGGTALGVGRGDECRALPGLPDCIVVLVCPARRVATAEVYQRWDQTRECVGGGGCAGARAQQLLGDTGSADVAAGGCGVDAVVAALERGDLLAVAGALWNDLRAVTETMVPEVGEIRRLLKESGALGSEMSGSGPACFGLFTSPGAAAEAAGAARACGHRVFVCRPIGRWPLYPGEGDFS